ncbi:MULTISPECIES: ferrochelatase [unclassified Arsukibacterium]|uniref:ferrochelatase n=1 Tax=unclassified Arsukibacterium TaxID=2635278 RepID=UPI000C6AD736|nr:MULTISPECIES: ferrochelatase [unclassified Arsukibacterium]MAA94845.1 ferrochelatase [Rheinheimera sp.]MBM35066.1 ferrochelatase [Rheinheimera sp.]|tara:strand:+ start:2348 stop:3433 length:1086 start_codon:yes stop_codon:yes gene_type:complete
MAFINNPNYQHSSPDKIGVLLTNLGTPDAPTPKALRRYLKQFLSDPRVVEVPRLLWWFILNGVILRIRPRRSAKAYATVFTEQGSPLLFHTRAQADAIANEFAKDGRNDVVVDFAMRYGNPSFSSVLDKMFAKGVRKILVLPLYPQYSASTSGSTFDELANDFTRRRWLPDLRFISHYHDNTGFIAACAERIKDHWAEHGRSDKLMFSYHGIPKRYLLNGDPYHCECYKTSRLIAEALGLAKEEYMTTFQSRFGREEWLKPYTDETLKALPAQGVKSVQIFCPGFAADCLETIEEIGEENHEYFMDAGGEQYQYISALNDRPTHIAALYQLINQNLQGWQLTADPERAHRAAALQQEKYGD